MVKLVLIFLTTFSLHANVYKDNCLKCHNKLPVSIDKYFYRYLLKYSSSKEVKASIYKYLKNPTSKTTVMPKAFIKRFALKDKSKLSEVELKKAIDTYWEEYKIFGRLK